MEACAIAIAFASSLMFSDLFTLFSPLVYFRACTRFDNFCNEKFPALFTKWKYRFQVPLRYGNFVQAVSVFRLPVLHIGIHPDFAPGAKFACPAVAKTAAGQEWLSVAVHHNDCFHNLSLS
jgi:hypothetical protein